MSQRSTTTPNVRSIIDRARTDIETNLTSGDWDALVTEIERNLYESVSIDEVYQAIIQVLTARIEAEPKLKHIAADLCRQRYYREICGNDLTGFELDREYREPFTTNLHRGVDIGLPEQCNVNELAECVELDRDEQLEYMPMETLYQRYFLKTEQKGEPPQAFLKTQLGKTIHRNGRKNSTMFSQNYNSPHRHPPFSIAA
jgi:hypothetical protein